MSRFNIPGMYEGIDYIIINDSLIDKNNNDDNLNEKHIRIKEKLDYFNTIPQYEQKSKEWLEQRKGYIGGSEAGSLLGMNHYEPQYKYLEKKIDENYQFINFEMVYHGNKHEDTAKLIYESLTNTHVNEYGFIPFNGNEFKKIFGASPDGIVSEFKQDLKHKTNKIGRMLEIKCPARRKINMDLNAKLYDIIPKYYYPQVIQQLESCDLEFCDFWQCNIIDYITEKKYKSDKGIYDYLTKDGKLRGVLIQILPIYEFKEYTDKDLYDPPYKLANKIYAHAKFIHPYNLLMSEEEKNKWIEKVMNQDLEDVPQNLYHNYKIKEGYKIHKIVYWKLENARCLTIKRNTEFLKDRFYIYEIIWNYKTYFSDMMNYEKKKYLLSFIKFCDKNKKFVIEDNRKLLKNKYKGQLTINKIVMYYVDILYNFPLNDTKNEKIIEYVNEYKRIEKIEKEQQEENIV